MTLNEKLLKDITIELFLKTIEIIKIFNPGLHYEQLLDVERKLIHYKKISFERWSKNYIIQKDRFLLREKRKLQRANIINNCQKWIFLKETRKLIFPVFVIILTSALIGWFAGISKNSCNPYFESVSSNQL